MKRPLDRLERFLVSVGLTPADAPTIWYGLRAYLDKLEKDLNTKYDGNESFGIEDEMFLGGVIGEVAKVLYHLEEAGFVERYEIVK